MSVEYPVISLSGGSGSRKGTWPIDIGFYKSEVDGLWVVTVNGHWVGQDSGKAEYFSITNRYGKKPTAHRLARIVRDLVVAHLKHEVEEALRFDGKRVFYPHAVKKPRKSR